MDILLALNRLALAFVFAVAGIGKLTDRKGSLKSIVEFGAPSSLAGAIGLALPAAELACALALLSADWAVWGAGGILIMLTVFSAAMVVNLALGRRPSCHCFGQIHATPIGASTLVRNAVLAVMAGIILWQGPRNAGLYQVWMSLNQYPPIVPSLVLAITALAGFQFWMLVTLLKQNGRLILRVEALERRLKLDKQSTRHGLPTGVPAPTFELTGLDGKAITLEELTGEGKPLLLVFVEPGCGPCEELMPAIAAWQRELDQLNILVLSPGTPEQSAVWVEKHKLDNVLVQEDRQTAADYLITGTPAAVLVKDGKIASHRAEGADAIRSLVVRSTLPPPVGRGEELPCYELPELGGGTVDLSTLKGRQRILLLWDPDCGYCKNVTEDVKKWERTIGGDAPELVIISAGSAEVVRALGFRSRVLLDPHFAVGTLLKARGTPSAVLLDAGGRIASEVGAGIAGVFELFGAVPFVPSEEDVADAMLKLAGAGRGDVVYDLGCGDGRIVIMAAKKYGARGVGVDINSDLVRQARARAKKARVERQVRFVEGDLLSADIREATVVTLYLLPHLLKPLHSKLLNELMPGARVVSHDFPLDGWEADKEVKLDAARLYLYTVPERA